MFKRKPLTYDFNALEPFIDTETMKEHYNVHYKKYTDNLNAELEKAKVPNIDIETIIKDATILADTFSNKLKDNAGGFFNHQLYFDNIHPNKDGGYEKDASPELKEKIKEIFGGYSSFKNRFKAAGMEVFGSGWVWLIQPLDQPEKLMIVKTRNQDNPLMNIDCKILLGMDVWEHSYYLKHRADRKAYIDDFFEVINWKAVSDRL